MRKHIPLLILVLVLALGAGKVIAQGLSGCSFGNNTLPGFYVSTTGNDNNLGTSPTQAWATVSRVNCGPTGTLSSGSCTTVTHYPANTSIFFQGGQNFNGCAAFKGYDGYPGGGFNGPNIGNATNGGLTVTSYGGGQAKITSTCLGVNTPAVLLDGVNNFVWNGVQVLGGTINDPIGTYTFFYPNTPIGTGLGPFGSAYTTGNIFTPNAPGNVSGGRYYKPPNEPTASRNIILWSCTTSACTAGTNVAQCTTSSEPTSGPISNVSCTFSSAYTITPGNSYVITADLPIGGLQFECGNGSSCTQNGNLPMTRGDVVYAAGLSTFPSTNTGVTYNNYPLDPIFNTTASYTAQLTYNGFIVVNNCGSTCTSSHITIENSSIQNFAGPFSVNPSEIQIIGDNFNGVSGPLDTVNILNNTLGGISGPTSPDSWGINGYGYGENITNVNYSGNTVANIGGWPNGGNNGSNGIVLDGVNGGKAASNLFHDIGANNTGCGGPGALETYTANAIIVSYNEAYNVQPPGSQPPGSCDYDAWDFDGGTTNSILEYNYSHHNFGSGILLYAAAAKGFQWGNNIVRFNISENDDVGGLNSNGGALTIGAGSNPNLPVQIYNNTIYQVTNSASPNGYCVDTFTFNIYPYGSTFENNICYLNTTGSTNANFVQFQGLIPNKPAGTYVLFSAASGTGINASSAQTNAMEFAPFAPGSITGLEFFKPANDTGVTSRILRLWSATGAGGPLASCTTSGETAGAMNSCNLASAYTVTPNVQYWVTADIPSGSTFFQCNASDNTCTSSINPIKSQSQGFAAGLGNFPTTQPTAGTYYPISVILVTTAPAGWTFQNNDYYATTSATPIWWISTGQQFTLANWISATGFGEVGSVTTNPQLTSVGNGGTCTWTPSLGTGPQPCPTNYKLQSGSPAASIGAHLLACPPGSNSTNLGLYDYYLDTIVSICGS